MDIELFLVPNCGRCRYLKELLQEAGLSYKPVDVSTGLGPLRRLRRLSGEANVPVLAVGSKWWPALDPVQARRAVREAAGLIRAVNKT